ncbi:family 2 glycosyl transferase [Sulfolobus acidocaldarius SUSAZ]|nr:family 2 glycosyl transferase [Sulfolobus acidocaldarius SUSAZ]
MTERKDISVIIAAYNRKKYIKEAITSVLRQDFRRDKYEVIVVKNFKDDNIDNYIDENNVKSIYTEVEELSGKFKVGIEESVGEILCFLEDDDKFYENKLRRVKESFTKYKDLAFYRNKRTLIDEHGNIILEPKHREDEYTSEFNRSVYASLIKRREWVNNSSICVRRNTINLEELKDIKILVDGYFFFNTLINRRPLLLDRTPLTYYRYHVNNISVIGLKDIYIDQKLRQKLLYDLEKIYQISKCNEEFNDVFYHYYIHTRWNYNIIFEDKRLDALKDSLRMLGSPFISMTKKLEIIGGSLLNMVFHNQFKKYLIKRRNQILQKLPESLIDH